jgi:type I restriction enzyme, S subunit
MSAWSKTTFGDVSTGFLSGGTPDTSQANFWSGDIPWITSKWLGGNLELTSGEKFITTEAVKKSATKIVPKDSIIFATRVGVGKVGINRVDLAINQDLAGVLIDNEKYDIKFIAYQLGISQIQQYVAMNKRGATIKGITRDCLEKILLNIPPLPEQKKIAHILWTVQRAIEVQERIIQTTTELKMALMQKLFTEGLRGEPQKKTEIGPVPESWEVVAFADSVSIKNGQVDPRQHPFIEMLHVGPENIESDTGRLLKLNTNGELKISSGNYHFTPEDVLYSKIRPYLNKVALPDFEGTCSADMYPLRSEVHFIRNFLFYYLLSDEFKKAAMSFQDRTGIPKINRAQLGSIHLACPTKEEQSEITEALFACDSRRDLAQRKKSQLQDLFGTLLHELMTARTRVHRITLFDNNYE